ncbi:MAG: hypothetical protein HC857_03895 [Synechococcales cyanobacterium RU_4_20]|nr:hypothetical protein [Synechococcales cyanobacterium RU_4_20]
MIDQSEEIFTLSGEEERKKFIEMIVEFSKSTKQDITSSLSIIIVMRGDFHEICQKNLHLSELIQDRTVLSVVMTNEELQQAISKPAEIKGYELENDLLSSILAEIKKEGSNSNGDSYLPLLQFTLTELWEKRDQVNHKLVLQHYKLIGGLQGSLDRHATNFYNSLPQDEQLWVERICLRIITGPKMKEAPQRISKEELRKLSGDDFTNKKLIDSTLEKLIKARLFSSVEDTVGLAHEAVMKHWKLFVKWRNQNSELLDIRDSIENLSREWSDRDEKETPTMPKALFQKVRREFEKIKHLLSPTALNLYIDCHSDEKRKQLISVQKTYSGFHKSKEQ